MTDLIKISGLSDDTLLETLCSTAEDEKLYVEFVNRFLPDLKKECKRICAQRKVDSQIGLQIAHDTLEKVRRYKGYNQDKVKVPNSRNGILLYLYRICTNLFNDHYKKTKSADEDILHKTYFDDILEDIGQQIDVERLKQIKDISVRLFNSLNKKEQRVVLTDIEYKKFHRYLPDEVNQRLADELGVKPDSVRKIRERAIAKLKKAINDINGE